MSGILVFSVYKDNLTPAELAEKIQRNAHSEVNTYASSKGAYLTENVEIYNISMMPMDDSVIVSVVYNDKFRYVYT